MATDRTVRVSADQIASWRAEAREWRTMQLVSSDLLALLDALAAAEAARTAAERERDEVKREQSESTSAFVSALADMSLHHAKDAP